jgi:hypothetical protein
LSSPSPICSSFSFSFLPLPPSLSRWPCFISSSLPPFAVCSVAVPRSFGSARARARWAAAPARSAPRRTAETPTAALPGSSARFSAPRSVGRPGRRFPGWFARARQHSSPPRSSARCSAGVTLSSSHRSAGAHASDSLARSLAARATLACLHVGWLAGRARDAANCALENEPAGQTSSQKLTLSDIEDRGEHARTECRCVCVRGVARSLCVCGVGALAPEK